MPAAKVTPSQQTKRDQVQRTPVVMVTAGLVAMVTAPRPYPLQIPPFHLAIPPPFWFFFLSFFLSVSTRCDFSSTLGIDFIHFSWGCNSSFSSSFTWQDSLENFSEGIFFGFQTIGKFINIYWIFWGFFLLLVQSYFHGDCFGFHSDSFILLIRFGLIGHHWRFRRGILVRFCFSHSWPGSGFDSRLIGSQFRRVCLDETGFTCYSLEMLLFLSPAEDGLWLLS